MDRKEEVKQWAVPENGLVIVSQDEDRQEELQEASLYCPVCYPVSKDLAILFMELSPDDKEQVAIQWDVFLGQLADSAEGGCHFCGFMAARFFNDQMFTFDFGIGVESPPIGCCGSVSNSELSEDVENAIKHLRHHAGDDNRITLFAESFEPGCSASRLGKVRFSAAFTNLPEGDVRPILGVRSEIVLELYTRKGLTLPSLNELLSNANAVYRRSRG